VGGSSWKNLVRGSYFNLSYYFEFFSVILMAQNKLQWLSPVEFMEDTIVEHEYYLYHINFFVFFSFEK